MKKTETIINREEVVKILQDTAYPLTLVINPKCDGALGLRHQAEIFYLNFPKYIKVKDLSDIPYEKEVNQKNIHLIDTDLQELLNLIKFARNRALKHYSSVVVKFFL